MINEEIWNNGLEKLITFFMQQIFMVMIPIIKITRNGMSQDKDHVNLKA